MRMFENRVLRRIFGPKREWRRLYNEELYAISFSPDLIWVIKPRRMRWRWHVARMGGEERCIQGSGGET